MRLNPKTLPPYFSLLQGQLKDIPVDPTVLIDLKDSDPMPLLKVAEAVAQQPDRNWYVSLSFMQAIQKAAPKIAQDKRHLENTEPQTGVMFLPYHNFVTYLLNPPNHPYKLIAVFFDETGCKGYVTLRNDMAMFGQLRGQQKFGRDMLLNDTIAWVCITLYFIQNCEVETREVAPKQKHRANNDRFYNESPQPFTILDCRWFTDLIRDTPFTVNGHLRWQPCGPQFSKRKLIWIEEFTKQGYTRKAGVHQIKETTDGKDIN